MRVVGLSSAVLFDKADPLNPINRRISIIVMKKHTEETVGNDGTQVEATQEELPDAAALTPAITLPQAASPQVAAPDDQPKM
jgi:chemotaxis protein MotB